MATIARPTTKTVISTTQWGIPITDQVNTNTTDVASLKPTAWTNVTYQNGWVSAAGYQAVSYRKVGDIVYMRGTATGSSHSVAMCTLPSGFRPSGLIELGIVWYSNVSGSWVTIGVRINTDGTIVPYGTGAGSVQFNAFIFSTLA